MSADRAYLVTGSASGIGAAAANLLEKSGGKVIRCDLQDADIETDLSSPEGRDVLTTHAAKLGRLDGVLAVAGGSYRGIIETNFFGAVATLEGLRPLLLKSEAPRALACSSVGSMKSPNEKVIDACLQRDEELAVRLAAEESAGDGLQVYRWAKNALNRWVRRVAPSPDWAGSGIPLNVVAPGIVDTPTAAPLLRDPATRHHVETEVCPQPLVFPGQPEWIAELMLWLVSPANAFVTGQIVFADGGADATLRGETAW